MRARFFGGCQCAGHVSSEHRLLARACTAFGAPEHMTNLNPEIVGIT